MKKLSAKEATKALTLVELLVVLAVIAILALMLIPATDHRPTHAPSAACLNNLRQIGFGLEVWANDHNGQLPQQVSTTNGGSMEFMTGGSPAPHFLTLTNELRYLKTFYCPADNSKQPATNPAAGFGDRNVSYFISVDATLAATNAVLAGDRNLQVGKQPVKPGFFALTTNVTLTWTRELHSRSFGKPCGNMLFADAHVERFGADLNAVVQRQGLATNRLAIP